MRVGDLLQQSAPLLGGRPALVDGDMALTADELDLMSSRMAAALLANGVRQGDHAAIFMTDGWEAILAILAVIRAGADFTPVPPSATGETLAAMLNRSHAACLVTEAPFVRATATAMAAAPGLRFIVIAGCNGSPGIDGILRFEDAIGSPASSEAPAGSPIGRAPEGEIAATALGRSFYAFVAAARSGTTFILESRVLTDAAE
jgi:acyl-CoA synthetase (AMP-forming)/AMP-acid ligase II